MSRIQVPTEKETLEFLSYASSINNLWSAFNNFNQNNSDETYRSFQLMYSDIVGILKEYTESPAFKKIIKVVDFSKNLTILDRLTDNVEKFSEDSKNNNGYVSKSLIIDIFADTALLGDALLDYQKTIKEDGVITEKE